MLDAQTAMSPKHAHKKGIRVFLKLFMIFNFHRCNQKIRVRSMFMSLSLSLRESRTMKAHKDTGVKRILKPKIHAHSTSSPLPGHPA